MKYYLCIDVGGSSIKYGVIDETANIIETQSVKAPKTLDEMYQIFENAFYNYGSYDLQGIAMSMPGSVDSDTGVIYGSSAYDYIHGPNIKQYLETKFNQPVEIENDANCAALAEIWKGAGKDVDDCCFIVCGTGIGGAIVKDKKIHKGKHLHGGEFGYMIADFDYDTKEMKTWSTVGSTVAVLRAISKDKGVAIETLDGKEIFDHYHDDVIYEKYVDRFYYALANGIYNLQYVYDPEKIIIGGGISERADLLEEINKRLEVIFKKFTHANIKPVVFTCCFHNNANLIGALYHFLTKNS